MNDLTVTSSALTTTEFKADLLSRFIAFADVKEKSKETYLRCIKQFFVYLQQNGIKAPSREDVIAYREGLKESHKASTIQTYITALKIFFKFLEEQGLYKNVADHIKGAKIDRHHKKDALTSNQAHDLISDIKTDTEQGARDYALLALMLTTGLRTIELERANIEDIRTVGETRVLFIQGKGRDDKNEFVKLVPNVDKALRNYLAIRGASASDKGAPLFTGTSNRNSSRLGTRSIRGIVKTHLKAIGLDSDRLTAHSLRHSAANIALTSGTPLREVQQLLRHSNISTTMIYVNEIDRSKNTSESRIASAIF